MELRGGPGSRLNSLDALRGAVMVLMALDHVRDFFHRGAMSFSPTDLTKTTAVLFLTRWITHFCLPVFMFSAGAGAFLWLRQGNRTKGQLSRFLLTRGVWFVFLELTVMQFAYNFSISSRLLILLLILWIFGICMIVFAGLIFLPASLLAGLSLAIVILHNSLDGIQAARFGAAAPLWNLVHQPGIANFAGRAILAPYTVLPWIGVLGLGYAFGPLLRKDASARRTAMLRIGWGCVIAFFLLRGINHYGDPAPWSVQKSWTFTALSFLNCTKYPGSLDFLLMTLGPALLALVYWDRHNPSAKSPLVIFGRVPFFYFVLHFYLIHALAVLMAFLRYGRPALGFIFHPLPSMGGPRELFPPGFGYRLTLVYVMWALVVLILFPLCRRYARLRAEHRDWWWLGYL